MCGKGTEKNQMAARLMSGCGAPFWRISAAQGAIRVQHLEKGEGLN